MNSPPPLRTVNVRALYDSHLARKSYHVTLITTAKRLVAPARGTPLTQGGRLLVCDRSIDPAL